MENPSYPNRRRRQSGSDSPSGSSQRKDSSRSRASRGSDGAGSRGRSRSGSVGRRGKSISSSEFSVSGEAQAAAGHFDRSTKPNDESGVSQFFLWAARLIVLAMIAVAPWCFGAVSQVAQTGLMALALAGLAMWWFSMAFGARSSQFFPSLAVPLILGIVLVGIQMVPLSNELAKVVAPGNWNCIRPTAPPRKANCWWTRIVHSRCRRGSPWTSMARQRCST